MFNALVPRLAGDAEPPDSSRRRTGRRRLGSLVALASALLLGFAMLAAPQPAQAVTSIDGQWTVVHGGTGQLALNSDGSYTSTCVAYTDYPDAWCPAPSGTFQFSTMSTASVTFTGADGTSTSYRVSGLVTAPDTITSYFGSTTESALVMKKGTEFVCTDWDTGQGSPLVEFDAVENLVYATGSHELLGSADFLYTLSETSPNYFQAGLCDSFAAPLHLSYSDASTNALYDDSAWSPRVTVTITDLDGAIVKGLYVTGAFPNPNGMTYTFDCTFGTCTLGGYDVADSIPSTVFTVESVSREDGDFPIAEGDSLQFTVYNPDPYTPSPTPVPEPDPVTVHVVDLDDVTTVASQGWQPLVDIRLKDSNGSDIEGAMVSGTFSGSSATVTCVTNAYGTCVLGDDILKNKVKSTVFTVTDVSAASMTYLPSANTDPDGSSDGTTITVFRP